MAEHIFSENTTIVIVSVQDRPSDNTIQIKIGDAVAKTDSCLVIEDLIQDLQNVVATFKARSSQHVPVLE